MTYAEKIQAALTRFGREVSVAFNDTSHSCHAIILPLRYKNKTYLEEDVTPLGIKDNTRSVYIGPASVDFIDDLSDTIIRTDEHGYSVTRADRIYFGDRPAYIWAVLANVTEE